MVMYDFCRALGDPTRSSTAGERERINERETFRTFNSDLFPTRRGAEQSRSLSRSMVIIIDTRGVQGGSCRVPLGRRLRNSVAKRLRNVENSEFGQYQRQCQ